MAFDNVVESIRELEAERTKYKKFIWEIIAHFSETDIMTRKDYERIETKHLQA